MNVGYVTEYGWKLRRSSARHQVVFHDVPASFANTQYAHITFVSRLQAEACYHYDLLNRKDVCEKVC